MHTTTPTGPIMSMDQSKPCGDSNDDSNDMLKKEPQDLAGLLSSPDSKPLRENGIKSESSSDIKEEVKDELKTEPGNPASVGNLPNGDASLDQDKGVPTPGNIKSEDKCKQETNGTTASSMGGNMPPQNAQHMGGPTMLHGPGPGMGMAMGGPGMGPGGAGGGQMVPGGGPMGQMTAMAMNQNGSPQHQVASDGHMAQQQSEIFVFTTQLANDAAQAVQSGQYKNLISFHVDQPATKKFLQRHPSKGRIGPGMQQGAYAGMPNVRGKMGMMGGPGGPPNNMGFGPQGPNSSNSVAQWVQQQNQNLQDQGLSMNEADPRMMYGPQNPNFSQMMMDGGMFDDINGPGNFNSMNMLQQNKVPNENLTPEQLHRREEQLANLRKIEQMLFPEQRQQQGAGFPPSGPGPGPGAGAGGPGMMPGEMGMYQQRMMASKRAMMMSQNMSSPHGMMESRQEMMSQEQFMMSQGMSQFGPGPHPQNMQNLSPAQREWMRLQQEYIAEKRQQMQQRQSMGPNGGPQMGPNGPQMGPNSGPQMGRNGPQMGPMMDPAAGNPGQPPPSYYSSIAQKQRHGSVGVGSPTSPINMNGPLGSPSMTAQVPESQDPMFPGHQRKGSFSGLDPILGPAMGPVGGMDPMMQQPPQGSPMNPNMMGCMGNVPPGMKNSQVALQRAGNPEQFHPELGPSVNSSANKPPPSYAQSQSTKRKRDDMEELCKNLQPTPSPQHISYLNQFDGQELTITKQINTAYREPNSGESQSNFTQNQVVNSPMHGPNSNKGPMSNSSQTSSCGPLGSPGPVTATQGSGPNSGANMRLSHFDPQQQQQQPQPSSISNSPTTPTGKASLSNITSSSLASLAKGVENLSNQMQQHMMQGGPFHSIQMQGQQQQQGQGQPPSASQSVATSGSTQTVSQPTSTSSVSSIPQTQSVPSVNNTYVNATMSIQQVNIQQSVNPSGGPNFNSNASASMQVQQTNMEQTQMNMQGSSSMTQTGSMAQASAVAQTANMTQSANMTQNMSGSKLSQQNTMPASSATSMSHPGMMGDIGPHGMSPFPQSQNPLMNPSQQVPPGSPSSVGNANVQIQKKAPNTIQYLPANQAPSEPKTMKQPDLDFIQQIGGPLGNVDMKVPTSKMQYFSGGSFGPGMGPGQDPRMGPGPGMGSAQDPRMGGQSMGPGSDPRIDPRMAAAVGGDPRMGGMGPDPRVSQRPDPRMPPDMRMSPDPRMGPGGMGPMSDPRMVPGMSDPRMVPGMSDPRMGPGVSDPRMGPGVSDPRMGPGVSDPRMGPGVSDPRMGPGVSDPRMGPGVSDPRMGPGVSDPRMGPGMADPRMGPGGTDPRMLPGGLDPRMGQGVQDPRLGPGVSDPRMGSGMSDPRMGPGVPDPRLGPASSMMGGGMGPSSGMPGMGRPGSRGSPFSGPIGPAVQQSMMMRRGSSSDIASMGMSAISGMASPDPMMNSPSMGGSMSLRDNPMSALSSMSGNPMGGNPMTSMSNMSNSIMSDPMGPMSGSGGGGSSMGGNMLYSPPYQGSGQPGMGMGSPMMPNVPGMSMQGGGPRMQGTSMSRQGPYTRQPSPGMRMSGPAAGPGSMGPLSPGSPVYSNAQYQQFQQQLYSQGRPRQMSPMEGMMGNPGPGYGMVPGHGMMPNMPGF